MPKRTATENQPHLAPRSRVATPKVATTRRIENSYFDLGCSHSKGCAFARKSTS